MAEDKRQKLFNQARDLHDQIQKIREKVSECTVDGRDVVGGCVIVGFCGSGSGGRSSGSRARVVVVVVVEVKQK